MSDASRRDGPREGSGGGRLGLFGGTFDPVHFGHLRPAIELAEAYALDLLYLVPNHRPAHRGPTGADSPQRIAMLELALADVPRLAVDAREARRERPSYTVDTLTELRAERPGATLLFFMGLDAFAGFGNWHRPDEILRLANLVVVDRPETTLPKAARMLIARQRERAGERIRDGGTGVIERCDVTQLAISATDIRQRVAAGLSTRFLLPDAVRDYIRENALYRRGASLS